jgi:hypothetical protein
MCWRFISYLTDRNRKISPFIRIIEALIYDTFDIARTCVNATMCPHPSQQ